jgi:hypothetical protein
MAMTAGTTITTTMITAIQAAAIMEIISQAEAITAAIIMAEASPAVFIMRPFPVGPVMLAAEELVVDTRVVAEVAMPAVVGAAVIAKRLLFPGLATIVKDFHLLERNEATTDHLVQCRQKLVDLMFAIHDFYD